MNKIKEFIGNHKKDIAIATIALTVGGIGGAAIFKRYVFKDYGKGMIDDIRKLIRESDGVHDWYSLNPETSATIEEAFKGSMIFEDLMDFGHDPDMKVNCVLIGVNEAEI